MLGTITEVELERPLTLRGEVTRVRLQSPEWKFSVDAPFVIATNRNSPDEVLIPLSNVKHLLRIEVKPESPAKEPASNKGSSGSAKESAEAKPQASASSGRRK